MAISSYLDHGAARSGMWDAPIEVASEGTAEQFEILDNSSGGRMSQCTGRSRDSSCSAAVQGALSTSRHLTPGSQGVDDLPSPPSRNKSWQVRVARSLVVSDHELFRAAPSTSILRQGAFVLSSRPCTSEYYAMSRKVDNVHVFISHNWDTPRGKKFLALAFHYNLTAAFIAAVLTAVLASILAVYGWLPTLQGLSSHGNLWQRGILSGPLGLLVFLVTLLGFHEVQRLTPWRGPMVFLDKVCVHQLEVDLKKAGIQNLAAFLHRSRSMLVLYSDVYFQKGWTMYEAATWLILHKGERMIVLPVSGMHVVLGGSVMSATVWALFAIFQLHEIEALIQWNNAGEYLAVVALVLTWIAYCVWSHFAAKWSGERDRIMEHIQKFSVASAQFRETQDRDEVQKNIIAFMKHYGLVEQAESEARASIAFEELVRRDVPSLFEKSFGRVGIPYRWLLCHSLPRILFACDAHTWALEEASHPFRLYHVLLFEFGTVFFILPLAGALALRLSRDRRLRNPVACVGIGTLCSAFASVCFTVTYTCMNWGIGASWRTESSWLARSLKPYAAVTHVAIQGALFILTYLVFSPRCGRCC